MSDPVFLKPANVLVDPRHGRLVARVTDFGMVKRADADATRLTATGAVLGTPAYMAPEQIRDSGRVDARADLFALGAMLFELVTGRRAFQGATLIEVFDNIRSGSRPSLSELAPDLPDPLRRAIDAALSTDPEARIASAKAMAALWRAGAGARQTPDPETIEAVTRLVEDRPVQTHSLTVSMGLSNTAAALVGREGLLARLTNQALGPGATTLVGPPGVGTSALAVAVAETVSPYLPGGVVWVPLGHARDEEEVYDAIIAALGVCLARRDDLGAALAGHGPLLLVLDHVAPDALGGLASTWDAPELRILATAHRPIPGWKTVEVSPLSPDAVRLLWAERAREPLEPERLRQILDSCGGLPRIVELAAACVGVSPDLPVPPDPAGWREVACRLLTPEARRAWEGGAVFRGGFTVEGLAAVLGEDELDVEDWLDELVDLGLVRSAGREGVPRFGLTEALTPAVEPDPQLLDRWLAWCVEGRLQPEDRHNLRLAMAHAAATGEGEGARTCAQRLLALLSEAGDDETLAALAARMQVELPEPGSRRRRLQEALIQATSSRERALEALTEARKQARPADEAWARALLARLDGRPDALRLALDGLDPGRRELALGWLEAWDSAG